MRRLLCFVIPALVVIAAACDDNPDEFSQAANEPEQSFEVGEIPGATVPEGATTPDQGGGTTEHDPTSFVEYPQPTIPPGGCASTGDRAVIVLGPQAPDPPCVDVASSTVVVVTNPSDADMTFSAAERQETINAGDTIELGPAGGFLPKGENVFWIAGRPDLSGILNHVG